MVAIEVAIVVAVADGIAIAMAISTAVTVAIELVVAVDIAVTIATAVAPASNLAASVTATVAVTLVAAAGEEKLAWFSFYASVYFPTAAGGKHLCNRVAARLGLLPLITTETISPEGKHIVF